MTEVRLSLVSQPDQQETQAQESQDQELQAQEDNEEKKEQPKRPIFAEITETSESEEIKLDVKSLALPTSSSDCPDGEEVKEVDGQEEIRPERITEASKEDSDLFERASENEQ